METRVNDENATIAFAAEFAGSLHGGDIVAIYGEMGVGKSVFCRSIIQTLSDVPNLIVPSPTFTLLQTYETVDFEIWHFDLYRMNDPSEIYELGWEEALSGNLTLIEWPERLGTLLPPHIKKVEIEEISDTVRIIKI